MKRNKALHIAFVANTSWSMYNFRIEVLRFFISRGFKVSVIAPFDSFTSKLLAEGVDYIPVSLHNYSLNPFRDFLTFFQLYRIMRKNRFDHVFLYTIKPNMYGGLAAWWTRTSYTAAVTGLGRFLTFQNSILNRLTIGMYKLCLKGASECWFLNDHDKNLFIELDIVESEKSYLLPSEGINTQKFRPRQRKQDSGIIRFLFAGRLLKEKGIEDFVSLARHIKSIYPRVKFEVLGYIDRRNPHSIHLDQLHSWQKEGYIKYIGANEDVRPYLERADCIVLPTKYQEGKSRILLEACSMEKPVITYENHGCSDIVIHGKTGWVCHDRTTLGLVEAATEFLDMTPAARIEMGKMGRAFVKKKFDVREIVQIYAQKLSSYGVISVSAVENSTPIFEDHQIKTNSKVSESDLPNSSGSQHNA